MNENILKQKKSGVKNFQLIVSYLQAMIKANKNSVTGFSRGVGFDIMDIFFPSFVNDVLSFLRPVISFDAAHLRIEYRGMLYIASLGLVWQ
jgi:hypothetical protein